MSHDYDSQSLGSVWFVSRTKHSRNSLLVVVVGIILSVASVWLLEAAPVLAADCAAGKRPCFVAIHQDFSLQDPLVQVSGFWYKPPSVRPEHGIAQYFVRMVSGQLPSNPQPRIIAEMGFISLPDNGPILYSLCGLCYSRNPGGAPEGWSAYGNHGIRQDFPLEFRISHDSVNRRTVWAVNGVTLRIEENTGFDFGSCPPARIRPISRRDFRSVQETGRHLL